MEEGRSNVFVKSKKWDFNQKSWSWKSLNYSQATMLNKSECSSSIFWSPKINSPQVNSFWVWAAANKLCLPVFSGRIYNYIIVPPLCIACYCTTKAIATSWVWHMYFEMKTEGLFLWNIRTIILFADLGCTLCIPFSNFNASVRSSSKTENYNL